MPPCISIIMPMFNNERYIADSIHSVLKQTFKDFEFIIIDDGSTDCSYDIASSFEDPRIRLLRNNDNKGIVYTRNRGIDESGGEYVAILDSDDIMLPNRLSKQFSFLKKHLSVAMVGSWVKTLYEENKKPKEIWKYPTKSKEINIRLLFYNTFSQSAVMMRRSMLGDKRYKEEYPLAHDYDLWIRIAKKYSVANIADVLVIYRIHKKSASRSFYEKQQECVKKIIKEQILELKVPYSKEEMDLHYLAGKMGVAKNDVELLELEKWLLKLIDTNKKVNRYNKETFEYVCQNIWFENCLKSVSKYGKEIAVLCRNGKIFNKKGLSLRKYAKLRIKMLKYFGKKYGKLHYKKSK